MTEKIGRVRKLLTARKIDGIVISDERNFSWISAGGRAAGDPGARTAPVRLLVTLDRLYCIADNETGPRVMDEELAGQGYEWVRHAWTQSEREVLQPLLKDRRILWDSRAAAAEYGAGPAGLVDLSELYFPVTLGEAKKLRWLGRKTSDVVEQVAALVQPGMSELDAQYLLQRELSYWDIVPAVTLASADDRTRSYARPVAAGNPIKQYLGIDVTARRWGLSVALSRRAYFGEPTPDLAKAWKDTPKLEAAFLAATRVGGTLGGVIAAAEKSYREAGFPEEWKLRDQGGPLLTGEYPERVLPGDKTPIQPGMVLAWSPMAGGARYQDTYLVRPDGSLENLTAPQTWPAVTARVGKTAYAVAGLWVRPLPPAPEPAAN